MHSAPRRLSPRKRNKTKEVFQQEHGTNNSSGKEKNQEEGTKKDNVKDLPDKQVTTKVTNTSKVVCKPDVRKSGQANTPQTSRKQGQTTKPGRDVHKSSGKRIAENPTKRTNDRGRQTSLRSRPLEEAGEQERENSNAGPNSSPSAIPESPTTEN